MWQAVAIIICNISICFPQFNMIANSRNIVLLLYEIRRSVMIFKVFKILNATNQTTFDILLQFAYIDYRRYIILL